MIYSSKVVDLSQEVQIPPVPFDEAVVIYQNEYEIYERGGAHTVNHTLEARNKVAVCFVTSVHNAPDFTDCPRIQGIFIGAYPTPLQAKVREHHLERLRKEYEQLIIPQETLEGINE